MRKKICIFCSLASFDTGMPISTYKLAAGLAAGGRFDVCAVLPEEGELARRMRAASVKVETIPFNRMKTGPASLLKFSVSYLRAGFRFFKFIRSNGIDIAHFSDIIDAPFYPVAKLAGARVVTHVRVCAVSPAGRFVFRVWARVFCSRIIAISHFVKRFFGFGGRARVVYNPGPDRALFDPEKFTAKNIRTVIAVSTFRKEKGLHNFFEIASRIKARTTGDVKFVIVGGKVAGHGKYYGEMMEEIRRRNLGGCLTITGIVPHEHVPRIMADAAALLHVPDWEEALGGVILEAMAMGVVPVAYDCGGVGECFTDGVGGFLVKRGDFDGAAERVISLLGDCELRRKMVLAARDELDKKFTLEAYIGNVEKTYGDMGKGRAPVAAKIIHNRPGIIPNHPETGFEGGPK